METGKWYAATRYAKIAGYGIVIQTDTGIRAIKFTGATQFFPTNMYDIYAAVEWLTED